MFGLGLVVPVTGSLSFDISMTSNSSNTSDAVAACTSSGSGSAEAEVGEIQIQKDEVFRSVLEKCWDRIPCFRPCMEEVLVCLTGIGVGKG